VFNRINLESWFGKSAPDLQSTAQLEVPATRMELCASAKSSAGKVRAVNEDAVAYLHLVDPKLFERSGALAVVVDGMGGEKGGAVASGIAVREIPRFYQSSKDGPGAALRKALEAANKEIYRSARSQPDLQGMGATCAALVVNPPMAWAAWVGDSRVYLLRNRQIFQMTEDHSLVHEMVREGTLTLEEAANHEDRNVVTRALGRHASVEVAVWDEPFPVRVGDRFLLCSDGLHDLLRSSELLELAADDNIDTAAAGLIGAANQRGGYDNISVILLQLVARCELHQGPAKTTRVFTATPEDLR